MIKKHCFDLINHQPSLSPNLWSVCWRRRVGLKQFFILCTQRIFVWCSKSDLWCHYTIICNKMPLIQWEQMVTKSCWQQVHIIKVKTKENERFRKKKARWNAKTLSEWEEGSPCFTTKPTNPRHFIVFFIGFLGSIVLRQNQSSALWATQWNVLLCSLVPQWSWCWRRTKQFYFESNSSCLSACFLISTYFLKLNWAIELCTIIMQ